MKPDSINNTQDTLHPYFKLNLEGFAGYDGHNNGIELNQFVSETFLTEGGTTLNEIQNLTARYDLFTYIILGLLFGIALLWYLFPERLESILNFPSTTSKKRLKESGYNSPGFLISFLLFLNYLITSSLFFYMAVESLDIPLSEAIDVKLLPVYIPVFIAAFYVFRILFIRSTGFLFKTNTISRQQHILYVNVDNLIGIILLPVIFLTIFSSAKYFILAGIILMLIFHLFRYLQTFALGKFIEGFSVFHLFVYLCTLEIIPLLVLIKLLKNGLI